MIRMSIQCNISSSIIRASISRVCCTMNATVADFKPISFAMCTFHKFPTKDRKGETVYMKIVLAYQKSQLLCLMFALALSIHYTRTQFSCNLASATMPIVNSRYSRSNTVKHIFILILCSCYDDKTTTLGEFLCI